MMSLCSQIHLLYSYSHEIFVNLRSISFKTVKWNSSSVTQDSFITSQDCMLLISIHVSMKIYHALRRPYSNLDSVWPLNSLLNHKTQRNWFNKCNFGLLTLSYWLLFVIVSQLQHKFFGTINESLYNAGWIPL